MFNFCSSLWVLGVNYHRKCNWPVVFSHSSDCLLSLLIISLDAWRHFHFMWSRASVLGMTSCAWILVQEVFASTSSFRCSLLKFSSNSGCTSGFKLRTLICFEFIFAQEEGDASSFTLPQEDLKVFPELCVGWAVFSSKVCS